MNAEVEYKMSFQNYETQAKRSADECLDASYQPPEIGITDIVNLAELVRTTYSLHKTVRQAVKEDKHLPDIVRNDPPSLRSTLWMVLIRDVVETDVSQTMQHKHNSSNALDRYPYRLYALTRCWLNGLDDVMDRSAKPLTKQALLSSPKQNEITTALGQEFLRLYENEPQHRNRIRETVREYRLLRDYWVHSINQNESSEKSENFHEMLRYSIESMGPLTYALNRTLSVNHPIDPLLEKELDLTMVLYAAAGKMIDDMTDWLKDHTRGELNLFNLALKESGELDVVVRKTRLLAPIFGKRTFVPISLFRKIAPIATQRYLEYIDGFIGQLEKTRFTHLTRSIKGVRQIMWAYALNEGLPQV